MSDAVDGSPPVKPLLALVVLLLLAGCSRPPAVCAICGTDLTDQLRGYNVTADRQDSTVSVQLYRNGTGRWQIRNELSGPDVSRLRRNRSVVTSVAERQLSGFRSHSLGKRNLSTRFEGDTVVISYLSPETAHHTVGGTLTVDVFNRQTRQFEYRLDARSLTLHAPEGMVIANHPPGSSVDETAVYWADSGSIADRTYVVIAPDRSRESRLLAQTAIALRVFRWAGGPYLLGMVVPLFFAPFFLGGTRVRGPSSPSTDDSDWSVLSILLSRYPLLTLVGVAALHPLALRVTVLGKYLFQGSPLIASVLIYLYTVLDQPVVRAVLFVLLLGVNSFVVFVVATTSVNLLAPLAALVWLALVAVACVPWILYRYLR